MDGLNNDFEKLRRLMAIKRYERPPAGHFDRLANRIRQAIEAESLAPSATWWERFISRFDMQPSMAAALALIIAAVYLYAFIWSQQSPPSTPLVRYPPAQEWVYRVQPSGFVFFGDPVLHQSVPTRVTTPARSSVHPIIGTEPIQGLLYSPDNREVWPSSFNIKTR